MSTTKSKTKTKSKPKIPSKVRLLTGAKLTRYIVGLMISNIYQMNGKSVKDANKRISESVNKIQKEDFRDDTLGFNKEDFGIMADILRTMQMEHELISSVSTSSSTSTDNDNKEQQHEQFNLDDLH